MISGYRGEAEKSVDIEMKIPCAENQELSKADSLLFFFFFFFFLTGVDHIIALCAYFGKFNFSHFCLAIHPTSFSLTPHLTKFSSNVKLCTAVNHTSFELTDFISP